LPVCVAPKTALRLRGCKETEVLFKKPFELNDRLEFLIGGGSSWKHKSEGDSIAGEIIVSMAEQNGTSAAAQKGASAGMLCA
jgi:hypothetical protein